MSSRRANPAPGPMNRDAAPTPANVPDSVADAVVRADPIIRLVAVATFALAVAIAIGAVSGYHAWLGHAGRSIGSPEFIVLLRRSISMTALACAFCLLLLAAWAAVRGRQVREQRRWPLRGARVLRDTRVTVGDAACKIGRRLTGGALVLLGCAIAVAAVSWSILP